MSISVSAKPSEALSCLRRNAPHQAITSSSYLPTVLRHFCLKSGRLLRIGSLKYKMPDWRHYANHRLSIERMWRTAHQGYFAQ